MLKKIISFTVSFILILSALNVTGYAKTIVQDHELETAANIYEHGFEEYKGEVYYKIGENNINSRVKLFMDMGIIDSYYPDASLKRTVMKKLINYLYGSDVLYDKYFGDGANEQKTLTFNEALYAFLDMTGFTRIAEMDGNKMETYINVANKNNFLDGINVSEAQKKLTAKTFFNLAHNVLFKVPLVRTNDGGKTYYLDRSKYFINELLGYQKVTGVVKANSYTSLNTLDSAGEGKIKIDEECYDADKVADFDDYLGFSVIAYINRDKDIVSLAVDESSNKMMKFDNWSEVESNKSKQTFTYYDKNDKKKNLSIDKDAYLLYNNVMYYGSAVDFYPINNGTEVLIDNDNDNVYEVVIKREYTSFFIKSKNENKSTVTDKNGTIYSLKEMLDDSLYRGIRNSKGEKTKFKNISSSYGISVLTMKDTNIVTELIICDESVDEGIYTTVNDKKNECKIGDKTYKISDVYLKECNGKLPHDGGAHVQVYLDSLGTVINSESTTLSMRYGYLMGIRSEAFDTVYFKLLNEDSEIKQYGFSNKVLFNNVKIDSDKLLTKSEIYDSLRASCKKQLIKFRTDSKGNITEIQTASEGNCGFGNTKAKTSTDFQMNLDYMDKYAQSSWPDSIQYKLYYYSGMSTLAGKYREDPDKTKVFVLPDDSEAGNEELYKVEPYGTGFTNTWRYAVNLYDVDDEYNIGAAVFKRDKLMNTSYGAGDSFLVLSSREVWNEKKEETEMNISFISPRVNYLWNAAASVYPGYENDTSTVNYNYGIAGSPGGTYCNKRMSDYIKATYKTFTDLKPGCIIKYNTNYLNYLSGYAIEFAYNKDLAPERQAYEYAMLPNNFYNTENYEDVEAVNDRNYYSKGLTSFGKIVKKCDNGFVFNADAKSECSNAAMNRRFTIESSANALVYHYETEKYDSITVGEIEADDFAFINVRYGSIHQIIVFRP